MPPKLAPEPNRGPFGFEIVRDGDLARVRVEGRLDEHANVAALQAQLMAGSPPKQTFVDARSVSALNSAGVREWIRLMIHLSAKSAITFSHLSEAMVEHAGMIEGFLGPEGTVIESFDAPYACPRCGTFTAMEIQVSELLLDGDRIEAPVRDCPKCALGLVLDAEPGEFFLFLKPYLTR